LSIFSCTLQHKLTIYLMDMWRASRSGDMSQPTGIIIESPQSGVPVRQRSRGTLKAMVKTLVEVFTYRKDGKGFVAVDVIMVSAPGWAEWGSESFGARRRDRRARICD